MQFYFVNWLAFDNHIPEVYLIMIRHWTDAFLLAVMGGICISVGGTAFLSTDNKITGTILFAVGLFTICTMGFNLFTGKVSYVLNHKPLYIAEVFIVWFGNLAGTSLTAGSLSLTRIGEKLSERASQLCSIKLEDNLLSTFILAIFCNLLIFIAIDGFKNNPHTVGKYIGLLFGVSVFIFSGFEHSIADMFYFSMGNVWSIKALIFIIVISLGNTVGGLIIPILRIAHKKLDKSAKTE